MNRNRQNKTILALLAASLFLTGAGRGDERSMESPFGVLEFLHWNHCWNNYKYPDAGSLKRVVAKMRKAGVSWVRMDFLWQEIEPEKGRFDFAKYDRIVDILSASGIKILGILDYNCSWDPAAKQWNDPPADNALFVNYACQVAGHYRGKVEYWEIWNEPDSAIYWSRQDNMESYCRLLQEVYPALKNVNPRCKVLNGGLARGIASVNHLYDYGGRGCFDILNIHIFEDPAVTGASARVGAQVKLASKIMAREGDGAKSIWVTEIGCPGVKKWIKTGNWWMGNNPDEALQAQWVGEVYGTLLKNDKVGKVFWAFFRDCQGHWGDGVDYFGLLRWDYSEKPAFKAYRKAVREYFRSLSKRIGRATQP